MSRTNPLVFLLALVVLPSEAWSDPPAALRPSPRASLQLIELIAARRDRGIQVAASYYLETWTHRLFEKPGLTDGLTIVEIADVPNHPDAVLKARLMLPGLSERGGEFVARNSFHLGLSEEELAGAVKGERIVKAYFFPKDAPDSRGAHLKSASLKPGLAQREWLSEIEEQGDLIVVLEITRLAPAAVDATGAKDGER
jgi:hypothetical protein